MGAGQVQGRVRVLVLILDGVWLVLNQHTDDPEEIDSAKIA